MSKALLSSFMQPIEKASLGFFWWAMGGSVLLFTLFKICYPYPDFISDSYNYVESAAYHLNVNLWPIGYARFLALVHLFSYNDTVLVSIQYILIQSAVLFLFYTVKLLFQPPEGIIKILFIALLFNPLSVYISNCVLGDAIFATLTITWITILLWQLKSPSLPSLITQVILMSLAFTIRPTAIYYPVIAALALLLAPIGWMERVGWILAPSLLFIPFIHFTMMKTEEVTGTAQFSVFGSWQLANNALYMYQHIDVDPNDLPAETRPIDRTAKQFFNVLQSRNQTLDLDNFTGGFFLKYPQAPLKSYMFSHYYKEASNNEFLAWGKVSRMYATYGSWLIRHYPLQFARYYLWLNTKNYFNPPLEKFSIYNYGQDSVWDLAQSWFHYPTPRVHSLSKTLPGIVFFVYPPIFLVTNIYFIVCLLWLGLTRRYRQFDPLFQKALALVAFFWLINFSFSVFAAPIVLRYQIVPYVLIFTFSILLLQFTEKKLDKFEVSTS